jgi:hypothetical protein
LRWLVALSQRGSGDGVMVGSRERALCRWCVGAEFERTMKMECENESENDHFCKSEGRVRFFKNDHFSVHFRLILKFIFEKWKKNEN